MEYSIKKLVVFLNALCYNNFTEIYLEDSYDRSRKKTDIRKVKNIF